MRTRSLWLLGGLMAVAVAAVLVGHQALASEPDFVLQALDSTFPLGGETDLLVNVPPEYMGGHGELYVQVEGYPREWVMDFAFEAPEFTITAAVPGDPAYAGHDCTYRFEAFGPAGGFGGTSTPAKRPIPPDNPEEL